MRARRLGPSNREPSVKRQFDPRKRATQLLEPAADRERSEIDDRESDVVETCLQRRLGGCVVSGDEQHRLGFSFEKCSIQAIGTLLKALTTRAPEARSATSSLDVGPESSPSAIGGPGSKRLVASTSTRADQSLTEVRSLSTSRHGTDRTTRS